MVRLRKKIEASYLCGIHVAHQRHAWQTLCMYSLPVVICVILSTLPTWPSVSSHPYLRFRYDYGSTKETCENFAQPIENHTWSREESLPSLLEGYELCDVYNAGETGLFFNVLSERTLAYKGETCHGGKHSKYSVLSIYRFSRDRRKKSVNAGKW
jgi:hypothetical protein